MDLEFVQANIRELWGKIREGHDLRKAEVREVLMTPEAETEREVEDATVRMWCDVLRLRG
jgi:hypothetical protein